MLLRELVHRPAGLVASRLFCSLASMEGGRVDVEARYSMPTPEPTVQLTLLGSHIHYTF